MSEEWLEHFMHRFFVSSGPEVLNFTAERGTLWSPVKN